MPTAPIGTQAQGFCQATPRTPCSEGAWRAEQRVEYLDLVAPEVLLEVLEDVGVVGDDLSDELPDPTEDLVDARERVLQHPAEAVDDAAHPRDDALDEPDDGVVDAAEEVSDLLGERGERPEEVSKQVSDSAVDLAQQSAYEM